MRLMAHVVLLQAAIVASAHPHALTCSPHTVDESSLGASRAAAWRRLRERWGWLDGLGGVDRSWIFWGAFHAYQQEG